LFGVGVGGAAASLLPWLTQRASAAPTTTTTAGSTGAGSTVAKTTAAGTTTTASPATGTTTAPGATTAGATATTASGPSTTASGPSTTAAPNRPTPDDTVLIEFVQTVEVAARELYDMAIGGSALSGDQKVVVTAIGQAHRAYAQILSGLLGRDLPAAAADVLKARSSAFGGTADEILAAAGDLESTLVATQLDAVGKLAGLDGAELLASIATVEARHCTVLADMRGSKKFADLLVFKEADALSPAKG
ncbi:MAG: ferritin-like domain-containing protein, partial [Ilumatobacteraceae bacterium]